MCSCVPARHLGFWLSDEPDDGSAQMTRRLARRVLVRLVKRRATPQVGPHWPIIWPVGPSSFSQTPFVEVEEKHFELNYFYQRVSIAAMLTAGIARGGMSVCLSVCLSVRYTPVLYQNEES